MLLLRRWQISRVSDDELLASVSLCTTLLEHFAPHCQRMISLQREKKNLGDHYISCANLSFVNPAWMSTILSLRQSS